MSYILYSKIEIKKRLILSYRALWWKPLREPLRVSAVVVDHVVPLHPSHPLLTCSIELLIQPRSVHQRLSRSLHSVARDTRGPNTSIGIEIL